MKYFMFTSQIEKFQVHKAFQGEFTLLRPESFYQPYAGLPKTRNETSPLKNSAQIGLRLITNVYNNGNAMCLEFISESRCLLDYDEPENEEQIIREISEKAVAEHTRLFTEELKKIGYGHSSFPAMSDAEKTAVYQSLLTHFRSQF